MQIRGQKNFGVIGVIANSKKMAGIFPIIILCISFSTPVFSQSYEYVNPLNARHTISIQISPAFFAGGDRAMDVEFCTPLDLYVCILSAEFNFAFPVARRSDVLQWKYGGYTYELVGQEKLQVFGFSFKVWVIESVQGSKKIRYLYSDRQGLLAFSVQLSDVKNTFYSMGRIGFGSQKYEGHSPK